MLLLCPVLTLPACAHRGSVHNQTLHHRALARDSTGGDVLVAELLVPAGAPPSLVVERWDRCGAQEARPLAAPLAAEVAARVEDGARLEEALPDDLRGEAPAWREQVELRGRLAGHEVRIASTRDRYGAHRIVQLVATDGGDCAAGPGTPRARCGQAQEGRSSLGGAVELLRAHAGSSISLAVLPGGMALARIEGPGSARDLRVLDLPAGARALRVAAGETHLTAGRVDEALAEVEAAAAFDVPHACSRDGALPWLRARVLATQSAAAGEVLAALAQAIAADPSRYRMYARMAPELAPLRDDPRFIEMVQPRRLEGVP